MGGWDLRGAGTEGFGRSDTPFQRRFFDVDTDSIVLATLSALVRSGDIDAAVHEKVLADIEHLDSEDIAGI